MKKYKVIQVPPSPDTEICESQCLGCGMIGGLVAKAVQFVPLCLYCKTPLVWRKTGKHATMEVVPDDTPEQMGTGDKTGV